MGVTYRGPHFSLFTLTACADRTFICGEPEYAGITGGRLNIPVRGAEPSQAELGREERKVLSREEFLASESFKIILGMRREGIPRDQWQTLFEARLSRNVAPYQLSGYSFTSFTSWLRQNGNLDVSNIQSGWMEPRVGADASALQRISGRTESIRERLLLSATERVINESENPMVIYGSGHFYSQLPSLERAFGSPEITCLSPSPGSPSQRSSGSETTDSVKGAQ